MDFLDGGLLASIKNPTQNQMHCVAQKKRQSKKTMSQALMNVPPIHILKWGNLFVNVLEKFWL